jgi:hypothetical protein
VQSQGYTTVAVQVLFGPYPDKTAESNLAEAIRQQMVKKLDSIEDEG